MKRPASAFSLVELGIVLVILGLLVGGILAGQSLIRASEIRAVGTESQKFRIATSAFRDKYRQIPGDITNATDWWGIAGGITGTNSACNIAPRTDGRTCNGDGNGLIGTSVPGGIYEGMRLWQHLTNAGLIEGNFNGTTGTYSGYPLPNVPGVNVPASKLDNHYWINGSSTSAGNNMQLQNPNGDTTVTGSLSFTPSEAWNLDTKLDDGMPTTGLVLSNRGNGTNTNCTDYAASTPTTPEAYLLSVSTKDCYLRFMKLP